MSSPAIRGESLRALAGATESLSNVDIAVMPGEVFGVLGPNGAGKSTLLRILSGDGAPASGRVWLRGEDVTKLSLWRRARLGLGYVPQTPSVLFDLTVAENIRTFEAAARVGRRPVEERAREFDLDSKLGVRARDLSGGERRSLEILRALIASPRVLLCDEPFAAGDSGRARLISQKLRSVAGRGGAVVIADHRAGDTLAVADRAMLLVGGSVEIVVGASAFADHPAVRSRYLT